MQSEHPAAGRLGVRAQSNVIGVILLTAVVVILVGGFGVVYLGATDDGGKAPLFDAEVAATGERVTITHAGGEGIPADELEIVVRVDGASERYAVDAANVSGGDGEFSPGERFARHHGLGSGEMEVLVVHDPSNAVIHQAYLTASAGEGGTTAAFSYGPTDPEPGQNLTFDANASTGAGGVVSYEWDWDGDGTVDRTTSSATVDHTFPATGTYDVTLTVTDAEGNVATTTGAIVVDYLRAADDPGDTVNGVNYQYYEAVDEFASMPTFNGLAPTRADVTDQVDLDPAHRGDEFAFRYTGYVEVPADGRYTFRTTSDDGSRLYVGDELVVDNDGLHANRTNSGSIRLAAGKHAFTVTMFEHTGASGLDLAWSGPGVTDGTVPAGALYRRAAPIASMTRSCAGRGCTFDASGSFHPSGSITGYEWHFGDGTSATGRTVSHTYDDLGQHTATLVVTDGDGDTDTVDATVDLTSLNPALSPGPVVRGVDYEFYDAAGEYRSLADVDWSSPTRTGTTDAVDLDPIDPNSDDVAMRYQSYLDVPENAAYTFSTTSDDGSRLYVDGQLVVDNPGLQAANEESGSIALEKGYHNVTVVWFEHHGQVALSASYASATLAERELPPDRLYRADD